ncbi:hypothetical protein [uncultured Cetobacterium sp.]|nr:hypothetical protein [uncultured Cetobacterium sp.]
MTVKEKEIEIQMKKSLDKIPFEIKKIKFILSTVKTIKRIKKLFKF